MPTPTYVAQADTLTMQRGIGSVETGIRLSNIQHSYDNPMDHCFDQWGGRDGFAVDFDKSVTTTMDGEWAGGFTATFGVAATIANAPPSRYGITPGDHFLVNGTVQEDRGTWKSENLEFLSIEGLTAA